MTKIDITKTRKDVEKEVRLKLKRRKQMRKDLLDVNVDTILSEKGLLVDSLKKNIEAYCTDAYYRFQQETSHADLSKIRVRRDNNYHNSWRAKFIFYVNIAETEDMFNKRVKKEVDAKMKRIHIRKKNIARDERLEKEKKRKAAIEAIKELGDEVYDVFEEIIKNDT